MPSIWGDLVGDLCFLTSKDAFINICETSLITVLAPIIYTDKTFNFSPVLLEEGFKQFQKC